MAEPTLISHHVELYRYWDAKRGSRPLPARRDIDPTEIVRLLPHIAIIDVQNRHYRWRLMGSALVDDFGRDLTGQEFGRYLAASAFVDELVATFDRVLADSQPIFQESLVYKASLRAPQSVSRLLLPLSTTDGDPGMVIFTRLTRFESSLVWMLREPDCLKAASGRMSGSFEIHSARELQARTIEWEGKAARLTARAA